MSVFLRIEIAFYSRYHSLFFKIKIEAEREILIDTPLSIRRTEGDGTVAKSHRKSARGQRKVAPITAEFLIDTPND